MVRFTLAELNDAGFATGNFVKKVANQVRDGACSLYRDYPGFMTGSILLNDASQAFKKGVWDSVCRDRPPGLPPPPTRPFNGGQTKCCTYRVVAQGNRPEGGLGQVTRDINGRLGGLFYRSFTDPEFGITQTQVGMQSFPCVNGVEATQPFLTVFFGQGGANQDISMTVISVTALDCVDSAPSLPYAWGNDNAPPPGALTKDDDVADDDGFNFSLPLVYAPITPEFKVPIDVGGIKFTFDAGGVDFNFGGDGGGDGDGNPGLGDRFDDFRDDFDDFNRKYNEDREKPPPSDPGKHDREPPPSPDDYDYDEKTEDDPKKEEGVDGLRFVKVDLTEVPSYVRQQFGGQSAPNIIYAGWFQFHSGTHKFPRNPIHYGSNIFTAPDGADGFSYTLTNDVRGTHTIIKRKPDVAIVPTQ